MKERLLNQLSLTRRLRQFLVLFTLLLMPLGVWADSYFAINTSTGSHWVTDENATNILGDENVSMSYDIANNVLTLDNAELALTSDNFTDAFIAMVDEDHPSITVHLIGPNTISLGDKASFFNGTSITFTAEDTNGSLSIETADGWTGALFLDNQSSTSINATYNSHLFLEKILENEYVIQTLICEGPASFNDDDNNRVVRFGDQTGCTDEQTHYSIDYVDENLQDVTNAVWVYGDADVLLLGPCIMTYYITAGGGQSETNTAKLFGLATNSVTTHLGTPVAPPTIVPAFDHSEDLIITETQTPATGVAPAYDGATGLISTSATGETTCSMKVDYYEASSYDYFVLNDMDDNEKYIFGDFTLTVNEAPTVYDLTVGGIPVTSANANDVLGDGTDTSNPTVTYDTENNTLNLENATINGDIIYTADNDNSFWINLYGTNSVSRITYTGQQEVDLFVCRAETNVVSHSLTVTGNGTDAAISGFHNIDEVNNEYYDIELRLYWKPTITNNVMTSLIITSNIFGGTGTESSPYIISTPTQLETFATLYNASELVSDCYVELGDDINCAGLQGFEPIGTPEMPFIGHFDGASHKISNLLYEAGSEDDYAGLFRKVGDDDDDEPAPGYVLNLTLENCTFRNGNMNNGAIAGILNKGTIDNCTVTSCTISSETSGPSSGGIVGEQLGGSITNCIVSGSTIAATSTIGGLAGGIVANIAGTATISGCQVTGTDEKPTTITGSSNYYDSGSNCTGGIVGNCSDFNYDVISISNNKVSGNTTISSVDNYGGNNTCAGAIVGNKGNASFSNNYYYYTVVTSTKNGEAEVVERSGYQQRGTGVSSYDEQLQVVTEDYDIVTDNGAMLYTKLVTFNIDTHCGMECDWGYELLSEPDNRLYYFAPGQPIDLNLFPGNGYTMDDVTLTYTEDGATEATVTALENTETGQEPEQYLYTFTMPNANATVNVSVMLDFEFVGSNLWASYYSTEDRTVPEGLTAYVVSAIDEESGEVTVASIDYIPASNAVLLKREQNGAANGYTAEDYTGNPATFTNLLRGSEDETDVSNQDHSVYVLFNDKFKRAISGTIPARRAYLLLGGTMAPTSAPQYLTISITDGNATAIDTLTVDDNSNDSWYTIDGLKLNGKPQRKGLYINNGKKVYINNNK